MRGTGLSTFALCITASFGSVTSPTRTYIRCAMVSEGENGTVHSVVSYLHGEQPIDCTQKAELMVLKCGDKKRVKKAQVEWDNVLESFKRESECLSTVLTESWSPALIEYFVTTDGEPCIAMEHLGENLKQIREKIPEKFRFSSVTLGSMGARMVDILQALHQSHGRMHRDIHSEHWALSRSDPQNLVLIDYGHCRSMQPFDYKSANRNALDDLKQIPMDLRYLFDGDSRYYMWKHLNSFREVEICQEIHPQLCLLLVYANFLRPEDPIDYKFFRDVLVGMAQETGMKYTGQILWVDEKKVSKAESDSTRADWIAEKDTWMNRTWLYLLGYWELLEQM